MKSLSFKRVISFCLALVAMISCVSVLAFADCTKADAREGTTIYVATSTNCGLWGSPSITIKNYSNSEIYVQGICTKDTLNKGKRVGMTLLKLTTIPAQTCVTIKLAKGVDLAISAYTLSDSPAKILVTPVKYIWNIWGGTKAFATK